MIENMRKYTGLMAVVIVLLAAGLILTMGVGDPNTGTRGTATEAYGKDISVEKYRELGESTLRVISEASDLSNPYGVYLNPLVMYANQLGAGAYYTPGQQLSAAELKNFVSRRLIIQNEAAALGIYPSREKSIEFIRENIFNDKDGNFNKQRYDDFLEKIGSSGYQQETFIQLVGEYLVNSKLQQVVAGGVVAPKFVAEKSVLFGNQKMTASIVQIELDTYKKDFNPSEEEVKTYWQENEGAYLSDRQLKISYYYEKPVYKMTAPTKPERKPETTDEEYAKLDTKYNKDLAEWNKHKKEVDLELGKKINKFTELVDNNETASFSEILTKEGLKVVTTDFFDINSVPAELKDLKTRNGEPIAQIFLNRQFGSTPEYQLQHPEKTKESGWIFAKFEEEKISSPKTFEAAKEQAKADLITKLAAEKLTEETKSIKAKLVEATKAGKSLEDAAKDLKLTVQKVSDVTPPVRPNYYGQPGTPPLNNAIYNLAAATDENSFTKDNWVTPTEVTLVYLQDRVVVKTEQFTQAQENAELNSSRQLQSAVYNAWLNKAIIKANIPNSF